MYSAVPQASEFLDPPTLSKGKTEKTKNKKKGAGKDQSPSVIDMTGFTALPISRALSSSPGPGPGSRTESPAPSMMKSSFSRVSEPLSGAGTPVNGASERTKVAFGFGMKRKADEDGLGTPPSKRR